MAGKWVSGQRVNSLLKIYQANNFGNEKVGIFQICSDQYNRVLVQCAM